MPSALPSDIAVRWEQSAESRTRLQSISFFLVGLAASIVAVKFLWNSLAANIQVLEESSDEKEDDEEDRPGVIRVSGNRRQSRITPDEEDATVVQSKGGPSNDVSRTEEHNENLVVSTTTGEGITTPMTFTRRRRCVLVDQLKIY